MASVLLKCIFGRVFLASFLFTLKQIWHVHISWFYLRIVQILHICLVIMLYLQSYFQIIDFANGEICIKSVRNNNP